MATLYSDQATNYNAVPQVKNKTQDMAGRIRVAFAKVTLDALTGSGTDSVEMFRLPAGARILEGILSSAALGASTSLVVGHATYKKADGTVVPLDVDEFASTITTTSITNAAICATVALGKFTDVDCDGDGFPVTITTVGAGAATGVVYLMMKYVLD